MKKRLILLLLILPLTLFGGRLPEVRPSDVSETLQQIMECHAAYKELTPTLLSRAIEAYIDDLDPTKTYFLASEVSEWLNATDLTLQGHLKEISNENFSLFNKIHQRMIEAIARRDALEVALERRPLPKNVSVNEFKDLTWAATQEELEERILKIRSIQKSATDKLDAESREKALQRIVKRRLSKEEVLKGSSTDEGHRLVLSNTLKAFASSLDTHTAYFTPGEASQFMIQVQQRLFGIGAQLRDDLNGFTIVKIIDGGPAADNTGLKVNDRVIAIDHEPVIGLEITDAVELIRGEEGTPVNLTVLRDESETKHEIPITRGEVVIKEARIESSTLPFGDGVIAYIALYAFYQDPVHSSGADLFEEISKIRKENKIKGIIVDLRYNSGGVLPQAVNVTGLFITKGIVCSIKDNYGNIEHLREIDGKMAYDGPLVILTSKASASAAEIVAQTLQDYGRAIIVGDEYTYGKGTFQTFSLDASNATKVNPKGEYKVTRGRYYTVSGKSPQLVGVKPDIVVPGIYSCLDIGEQHSKYPLENDSISENFQDDLSDIPAIQRDQISWLYRFNLQPRLKLYTRFLPVLRKNSEERIERDKLYQCFLKDISQDEDVEAHRIDIYSDHDPQLKETVNIIKDLILLLN